MVWAADSSETRLATLRQNLTRLRLDASVVVLHRDWAETAEPRSGEPATFDRILLDAPCSNTGVIRRRIDVPWRLRESDFHTLPDLQLRLLAAVAARLAPGGKLVYSTCSLDRSENEAVAGAFSARHPQFRFREDRRILPWRDGFDGAYAAVWEHSGPGRLAP
jgi:16S rRNA (cytosine967-C5)-methyltransferase